MTKVEYSERMIDEIRDIVKVNGETLSDYRKRLHTVLCMDIGGLPRVPWDQMTIAEELDRATWEASVFPV